jgi:chorismate synthase
MARRPGSRVHDEIAFDAERSGFERRTNNAGGTEGGMSTGAPLVARVAFKPLSTLMSPLQSVDIRTKTDATAAIERSDVCAVPAAAVICEAVTATVVAQAFFEKFAGDSYGEVRRNYQGYVEHVRAF